MSIQIIYPVPTGDKVTIAHRAYKLPAMGECSWAGPNEVVLLGGFTKATKIITTSQFIQGNKIHDQSHVFHERIDGTIDLTNPKHLLSLWDRRTLKQECDRGTYYECECYASPNGKVVTKWCQLTGAYYSYRGDFFSDITVNDSMCRVKEKYWSGSQSNDLTYVAVSSTDTTVNYHVTGYTSSYGNKVPVDKVDTYSCITKIIGSATIDDILDWVGLAIIRANSLLLTMSDECAYIKHTDYSAELYSSIASKVNTIDINGLGFCAELREFKKQLPPLYQWFKKPLSPKTWADTYLWYKYGFCNTISDLNAIQKGSMKISTEGFQLFEETQRVSATRSDCYDGLYGHQFDAVYTRVLCIKPEIQPSDIYAQVTNLRRYFGIEVNATNIWDLVPFSFVVDWFVDIGGLIDKIESFDKLNKFTFVYQTDSQRVTSLVELDDFTSSLVYTRYVRVPARELSPPPLRLQIDLMPTGCFVEAAALVISNKS